MPTYKLLYFDIAGKGEGLRLALTYAGVPFEDYRFASREEFGALKASGALPFGQVPALEVTDGGTTTLLSQSAAILRFVAKLKPEKGLYPADPLAAARVDAVCDLEADAFVGLRVTKYKERFGFGFLDDGANAALLAAATADINAAVIPRHLANLAKVYASGGTPWLAGTAGPSTADFTWAPVLAAINDGWTGDKDTLKAFPTLVAFLKTFYELPAVADYYKGKEGGCVVA